MSEQKHNDKFTIKEVQDALIRANGFISKTAELLLCTIPTVHNYIEKYPEVKQTVNDIREKMIDFTENKLFKLIENEDRQSILFYLKTIGKKRGYIEQVNQLVETNFVNPNEIKINIVKSDLKDLNEIETFEN